MKKILALLLAMLLVLSVFASCGTNDGEETEDTEKKTEATGDSEKETEKESEKETEKESDGGSDAETPACQHPDADKSYTSVDATNHKVTCKCGATVAATEAHSYDNDADMKCNKCNYDRTPAPAPACTHPEADKTYTKIDATNHKVTCKCGATVVATEAHTFASETTAKCDKCDYTRCIHADANGDFVCDTADCGTIVEPAAGELTLAQAIALANLYANDKYSTNKYSVTGIIVDIPDAYSSQYKNITVSIAAEGTDGVLKCWRLSYDVIGEEADKCATLVRGDTITVNGVIGKYADAIQIKQGKLTNLVPHGDNHNYVDGVCTICGGLEVACQHTSVGDDYICDNTLCGEVVPPAADSVLTLQQAANLGLAHEHNTYTEGKYYVEGTIASLDNNYESYGNITITDGENTFTIYGIRGEDGGQFNTLGITLNVGDSIKLYGIIGQYNNKAQMKNAWIVDEIPGSTPTCDHANAEYVDNEDGTHTLTCDCETTFDPENHTFNNGVCDKCDAVCAHENKTCTNIGNADTHTWECACGLNGTEDHDFDGMICKDCGFDKTPTGTCAHDEYDYVNNNDGTHTATCKNVDCDNETGRTFTENHNYENGVCDKCDAVCAHENKNYTNNGADHSWTCACGVSAENEEHVTEGPCACSTACEVAGHNHKDYNNNGEDHSWTCTCGVSAENEEHFFDGGTCVCEATCAHESKTYTKDGANHTWTCDAVNCTATGSGSHTDATGDDYKCDDCGAVVEPDNTNPLTIVEAIKLGNLYDKNKYTTNKYSVTGVVKEVVVSNGYGNVTITDGKGNDLYIYGLYGDENYTVKYPNMNPKPVDGDTITVYGVIGKYNSVQMNKGWATDVVHTCDYTNNNKCACGLYEDSDAGKAQEALDAIVSNIKATYNENFVIDFSEYADYTWTVNDSAVINNVYEVAQTDDAQTIDLKVSVTVNEATVSKDITITIAAKPSGDQPTILATFEFGENTDVSSLADDKKHKDGNTIGASKTYSNNGYELEITGAANVYDGGHDYTGNSALKLGTSSKTGSFSFTVANDVTQVVIRIAKYKYNATNISINGGETIALDKNSSDGEYQEITIDTSTNKNVSITTVSGGVRAMIDSISFIA